MTRLSLTAAILAAAVVLAGCSTPTRRIKQNPEIYAALSADQQAKVKEGEIGIGFSQNAVLLALGRPDATFTRRTAGGEQKIWAYHGYELRPTLTHDRYRAYPLGGGRYTVVRVPEWGHTHIPYEQLRVVFDNDQVVAIEEENQR